MKRKTYSVAKMVERANRFLRESPDSMRPEREAIAAFLSTTLHETGNYKGFGFLQLRTLQVSEFKAFMASPEFDESRREYAS